MKKVVVVTGANGGLGKECVASLLKEGYRVIAVDLSFSLPTSPDLITVKADLTNEKDITKLDNAISKVTSKLYAIVNLAGIYKMESLIEGNEEDLRHIIEVNFFSTYKVNKTLFHYLNSKSKIIVMSSEIASISPQPFMAYYSISKKMVDAYADVLRRECNYLGIKVIKIQAGSLKTSLLDKANDSYNEMVKKTNYFKTQLTKLKQLMVNELKKQHDPKGFATLVSKILKKEKPRICYKYVNSFALKAISLLPETMQDKIYTKVIK